ncbi:hypothetical protein [Nitrosomonas halophila]|uniref:hypothetical protein n=1 Tax=Nitrosomonas halophila TaxID=44576 RepID=UPI0015A441E2|nr:hypothetical protein [Nitrosomonas halophila]
MPKSLFVRTVISAVLPQDDIRQVGPARQDFRSGEAANAGLAMTVRFVPAAG